MASIQGDAVLTFTLSEHSFQHPFALWPFKKQYPACLPRSINGNLAKYVILCIESYLEGVSAAFSFCMTSKEMEGKKLSHYKYPGLSKSSFTEAAETDIAS